MKLAKEVTFFYTDFVEKETLSPIAREAKKRGYTTKFSDDLSERCSIGVYCQDELSQIRADFKIVMLHGLDQGRGNWPNFWRKQPWDGCHLGFLPGPTWVQRWKESTWDPHTHPKMGMVELGWPKSDRVFFSESPYKSSAETLRNSLGLPFKKTILYAPSYETDFKQDQVFEALKESGVNLLIKHWIADHFIEENPEIYRSIEVFKKKIEGKYDFVRFINPKQSIMECLGISDLLITDESSVLYEALLFGLPTLVPSNWVMRRSSASPSRKIKVPELAIFSPPYEEIGKTVEKYFADTDQYKDRILEFRDSVFSYLGSSSKRALDCLDRVVEGQSIHDFLLTPPQIPSLITRFKRQVISEDFLITLYNANVFSWGKRIARKLPGLKQKIKKYINT